MAASNYNWVCFECRVLTRQPKTEKRVPTCTACGEKSFCLGYKVEVPKKSDIRAWRKLRDDCRNLDLEIADQKALERVRTIHDTEREILRQNRLPATKERKKYIEALKQKIA